MFSFAHTIINLNMFTLRTLMGVVINDNFVHVTKDDFSKFYLLQVVALVGACIPFLYIYCMIPTLEEVKELENKNNSKSEIELTGTE